MMTTEQGFKQEPLECVLHYRMKGLPRHTVSAGFCSSQYQTPTYRCSRGYAGGGGTGIAVLDFQVVAPCWRHHTWNNKLLRHQIVATPELEDIAGHKFHTIDVQAQSSCVVRMETPLAVCKPALLRHVCKGG